MTRAVAPVKTHPAHQIPPLAAYIIGFAWVQFCLAVVSTVALRMIGKDCLGSASDRGLRAPKYLVYIRARLAARPSLTGSPILGQTMGMVVVACRAARAAPVVVA
jgi:hypothetical protein